MENAPVEVIAGVNLPMLIKLASVRGTESLQSAVAQAQEARAEIHQRRLGAACPGKDAGVERPRVGIHHLSGAPTSQASSEYKNDG